MRWGRAIRRRKPGAIRLSYQYGDMICGAHPIDHGTVDPQTGDRPRPRGEDCRDLNPDGTCGDFVRASWLTRLLQP